MIKSDIQQAFLDANNLLQAFCTNPANILTVTKIADQIANTFKNKGKVLICGNGGSNCDAMHFAEEFTGQFRKARKALPAISLSDPAHITCVANDFGFEQIFSRGVEAFGNAGDCLIALSTSGNSPNIIKAVETAQHMNIHTIGLFGKNGGKLANTCDLEIIVPATTSDRIQEIHMLILHIVIEGVERILFPENYIVSQQDINTCLIS